MFFFVRLDYTGSTPVATTEEATMNDASTSEQPQVCTFVQHLFFSLEQGTTDHRIDLLNLVYYRITLAAKANCLYSFQGSG